MSRDFAAAVLMAGTRTLRIGDEARYGELYLGPLDEAWVRSGLGATAFGSWIGMSLVIVGHCHVALAALAWRFAKRVRALSTLQLSTARHGGWSAYGWTLVSSLPVAILLLIPTALVAITGVFFIPGMFALMHRRLLTERAMLAEA